MIKVTMDLTNNSWHVDALPSTNTVEAEIWYTLDPKITTPHLKNFSYKLFMEDENGNITPPEFSNHNVEYTPTEYPVFVTNHTYHNLLSETKYFWKMHFWHRRQEIADKVEFSLPVPSKPFESWTWNSEQKKWVPPQEPPSPTWDENSQSWYLP